MLIDCVPSLYWHCFCNRIPNLPELRALARAESKTLWFYRYTISENDADTFGGSLKMLYEFQYRCAEAYCAEPHALACAVPRTQLSYASGLVRGRSHRPCESLMALGSQGDARTI